MKDHNCPYLGDNRYCTHKGKGLRRLESGKVDCIYNNPLKCHLLKSKSKVLLRKALLLIGKPFGLEAEEYTLDKEKSIPKTITMRKNAISERGSQ